jgi:hypothetical protein
MQLQVRLDGGAVELAPAVREREGVVWVPAQAFSEAIGAECKEIGGQWAVCREDLCISLTSWETEEVEEVLFARLDAFAEPLWLEWSVEGGILAVVGGQERVSGLGVGQTPPAFELPDLFSGELVSSGSFRGKKTFFYMWASW